MPATTAIVEIKAVRQLECELSEAVEAAATMPDSARAASRVRRINCRLEKARRIERRQLENVILEFEESRDELNRPEYPAVASNPELLARDRRLALTVSVPQNFTSDQRHMLAIDLLSFSIEFMRLSRSFYEPEEFAIADVLDGFAPRGVWLRAFAWINHGRPWGRPPLEPSAAQVQSYRERFGNAARDGAITILFKPTNDSKVMQTLRQRIAMLQPQVCVREFTLLPTHVQSFRYASK